MRGLNLLFLPPFSIVARFFLTSALFGFLGSLLALHAILSGGFSLPALVHTFTLGFITMTMLGALFQMLPVVAGAIIERPSAKATFTHTTFTLGVLLFILGLRLSKDILLYPGLILISLALLFVAPLMLFKLLKQKGHTPTTRGMKFALGLFLPAFLSGLLLILSQEAPLAPFRSYLVDLHMGLMLWGWVALLVASVAFRVIEMFFVTPPYPTLFSYWFAPLLTLLLILNTFTGFHPWTKLLISLLYISFALLTFTRLVGRRRKVPDPLIGFWYTGMIFLIASAALYPFTSRSPEIFLLFLYLFGTFAQSVIMAMMYRIIPFLVWIHLSNRGVPDAPTMHEVIEPKRIRLNLYLHLLCILSFFLSLLRGELWKITGLLYTLSFGLLLLNLSSGVLTFLRRAGWRGVSLPRW